MPELGLLGTVRGALRNERPYREQPSESLRLSGETGHFSRVARAEAPVLLRTSASPRSSTPKSATARLAVSRGIQPR